MTGEQNLSLIRRIEEHREFLLTVLSQNPALLARAEPRVRELMEALPEAEETGSGAGPKECLAADSHAAKMLDARVAAADRGEFASEAEVARFFTEYGE